MESLATVCGCAAAAVAVGVVAVCSLAVDDAEAVVKLGIMAATAAAEQPAIMFLREISGAFMVITSDGNH